MFDVRLRKWIDPALNRAAEIIARSGIGANAITLFGAALTAPLLFALIDQNWTAALLLIAANRALDGLDGAVARLRGPTAWGGYLDSLCDYCFYLAVPLGFALADPENLLPALWLVASFTLTAVSFLALAAILAKQDVRAERQSLSLLQRPDGRRRNHRLLHRLLFFPNMVRSVGDGFCGFMRADGGATALDGARIN